MAKVATNKIGNKIKKATHLMLVLSLVSLFSGCQKYTNRDYEDLEYEYHILKSEYDDLKNEYDILQNEMDAEYMTTEDYYNLSDFAGSNSFRNKGFYSTAYCLVLETGSKTTIRICFENEGTVYYETDNDHCSVEWGEFDNNGQSPFTIIGISEGITYFTFTNDIDNRTFQIVVFVID